MFQQSKLFSIGTISSKKLFSIGTILINFCEKKIAFIFSTIYEYQQQQEATITMTTINTTHRVFEGKLQNPTEFSSNFKSTISKNAEKFRDLLEQHKNKKRWLNQLQDWVIDLDSLKPETHRIKMVEELNSAIKKNKKFQYLFENERWFYANIIYNRPAGRDVWMYSDYNSVSFGGLGALEDHLRGFKSLVKRLNTIELPAPKKQKLIIRKKKICSREVYLGDGVYVYE